MYVASRFAIAVHVLALLGQLPVLAAFAAVATNKRQAQTATAVRNALLTLPPFGTGSELHLVSHRSFARCL